MCFNLTVKAYVYVACPNVHCLKFILTIFQMFSKIVAYVFFSVSLQNIFWFEYILLHECRRRE